MQLFNDSKVEVIKDGGFMMTQVKIDVPDTITKYVDVKDAESIKVRNAMILYPYVRSGVISYGRAAELLGIYKIDLISLYGSLGVPYLDMSDEEFDEEIHTVRRLEGVMA